MKSARYSALLVLTSLIWGLSFVAQRVGMDYVGPFTFNAIRNILGALVLLPCIWFFDRSKPVAAQSRWKDRTLLIGGSCCGVALAVASSLQQFGIVYTTVGKAGFITALYIVIVPLLGLFLKHRVGLNVWVSVCIAVVGMYLLCINDSFVIAFGDVLMMLCALVFSIHILLIDHFSPKVDAIRLSCLQFLVCGALCGICMFMFEAPSIASILSAWLPILYAGVLSCGVAYTLQVVAQRHVRPTVASLILSLESVFAALFGWLILGQTLSGRELFGCALVFCAILLVQLRQEPALAVARE